MKAYSAFTHWLEHHMLSCPSKKLLTIDCPGCGLQRSVVALLKGDIANSWHIYPPGIFIVATVIFLLLHLSFGYRHGAAILKCLYFGTAVIIIANYIYKITTNQLI